MLEKTKKVLQHAIALPPQVWAIIDRVGELRGKKNRSETVRIAMQMLAESYSRNDIHTREILEELYQLRGRIEINPSLDCSREMAKNRGI